MKRAGTVDRVYLRHRLSWQIGLHDWRKSQMQPPKKHEPIYRGEARQHLVQRVMDVLRDWRLSPFENEGAATAGLRGALCLKGYGWEKANREASEIVAEGLRLLGAVRPTWEQGQREYSVPKENCSWCYGPIGDDLLRDQRRTSYCSDVCARAAIAHRDFGDRRNNSESYQAAWDTIYRTRHPARECLECGKSFRPQAADGVYCSRACAHKRQHPDRHCQQCGKTFRPRGDHSKFCSSDCASSSQRTLMDRHCQFCAKLFRPSEDSVRFCSIQCVNLGRSLIQIPRECEWCGGRFMAKSPKGRCCSHPCSNTFAAFRAGRWVPKRISPPVFDYVFKLAA